MRLHKTPSIVGGLMGLGMMWMLHASHETGTATGQIALLGFVAAHVAVGLAVILAGVFVARLSPAARVWMARLHRPSLSHLGHMAVGMLAGAAMLHLTQHGIWT